MSDRRASGVQPGEGIRSPGREIERPTAPVDSRAGRPDPLVAALVRYVEALHARYPEGPDQLRREGLDARAKVSRMVRSQKDPAA